MLHNELETGSKTLYLKAMEARVYFQLDTIMQFWDIITQYQAWHQYVTENKKLEVVEIDFSQTQAS